MKWLRTIIVFDRGDVVSSQDWKEIHESYVRSIASIEFPRGQGSLKLRRKSLKTLVRGKAPTSDRWLRNGVGYLRSEFLSHIVEKEAWQKEAGFSLGKNRRAMDVQLYPGMSKSQELITSKFGSFDLVTTTPGGTHVAIEWETGNISSSHRSMNKLAIALETGKIQIGVLIVPSRDLYDHLTDRIGNIGELSGYLAMWQTLGAGIEKGLLAITVVEHDELTDDADHPYLSVGIDGRSQQRKIRKR